MALTVLDLSGVGRTSKSEQRSRTLFTDVVSWNTLRCIIIMARTCSKCLNGKLKEDMFHHPGKRRVLEN